MPFDGKRRGFQPRPPRPPPPPTELDGEGPREPPRPSPVIHQAPVMCDRHPEARAVSMISIPGSWRLMCFTCLALWKRHHAPPKPIVPFEEPLQEPLSTPDDIPPF
jgi:hypothetical protein